MYINCFGGEVYVGLVIYDIMCYIKVFVLIICVGMVMSMGSVFLMVGDKGKCMVLFNSCIMIYQGLVGFWGNIFDFEVQVKEVFKLCDMLVDIYYKYIDLLQEKLLCDMECDYFMLFEEVFKYGLID